MEILIKTLIFLGMLVVVALLVALPLKWLWNWLMPELFNLQQITFWQALGLSLLSSILFKSSTSSSKS